MKTNTIDRFWPKVKVRSKDKCWTWLACSLSGYGKFWTGRRVDMAHRYSYELHHGVRLKTEQFVLHKCDNPLCVNPHHLFLGTQADNMKDMHDKGRNTKGTTHVNSKMNPIMVRFIRKMTRFRKSSYWIADAIGVSQTAVLRVVQKTAWTSIK